MFDLFDYAEQYPNVPGSKESTTSADAADSMKQIAPGLRDKCLSVLRRAPATADEVGFILGITPFSARPRIAELNKMGKVYDTGERRLNASGRAAKVFAVVG